MDEKKIISFIGGFCALAIIPLVIITIVVYRDKIGYAFITSLILLGISSICSNLVEKMEDKNKTKSEEKPKDNFAECQAYFKKDYLEFEKISQTLSANDLSLLYRISQQKYYDFQRIRNEALSCLNKLKCYTSKSDECCATCKDGIEKMKEFKSIVSVLSKEIKEYNERHVPQLQQTQEPPKPQLSENEKKLKDYEEKQYLKADEIGRRYERYIGYLYEIQGYKVDYNGIKKGVKDGGIDLICSKGKYITIIQCKCRDAEGQIHENTVLQLIANLARYTRKNPKKSVAAILYTSHDNLDDEAKNALNDEVAQGAFIYHEIKPYDNSYPKVKCNISSDGEKIYHLPDHSSVYDRIQIEIKKGEFFAKTIKEAENAGFRASKS